MEKQKFSREQIHLAAMALVDVATKLYLSDLRDSGEANDLGESQSLTMVTPNFHHSITPVNSENLETMKKIAEEIQESDSTEDQEAAISRILAEAPSQLFGISDPASAITALGRATGSLFLEMDAVPDDGSWQVGKVRHGDYDIEFRVAKRVGI